MPNPTGHTGTTTRQIMISRTLARSRSTGLTAIGVGVGLGLGSAHSFPDASQQQRHPTCHVASCKSSARADGIDEAAAAASGGEAKGGGHHDEAPTLREAVMGSYEDRIRNFSSAERVFEFFASVTNERGTFMTSADFARAITPYQHRRGVKVGSDNAKFNYQARHHGHGPTPREVLLKKTQADSRFAPAEAREELEAQVSHRTTADVSLTIVEELGVTQERLDASSKAKGGIPHDSFTAMVDIDGDGLISYQEFMLFRTLIAIPKRKLAIAFRMFDRDDSGAVDWVEFEAFMNVLKGETNVGKTEVTRKHRQDAQAARRLFFSGDGDQLTIERFTAFVELLQREALVMQFHQWDERGEGMLTATDFAKFLATKVNADRTLYKEYLQRAESEKLAELEGDISVDDFLAFHELLHHLPEMEVAMKVTGSVKGRGLNRPEFMRAAKAALEGGRLRQQSFTTKALDSRNERVKKAVVGDVKTSGRRSFSLGQKRDNTDHANINIGHTAEQDNVLSPVVLDTLFALLDTNDDGRLDQDEFMKLMTRQTAVPDPPRTLGVISFLRRLKECAGETLF